MRVLLVTSPNEQCGIAEYGDMLIKHTIKATAGDGKSLEYRVTGPVAGLGDVADRDLVVVNHHAALHSGWTPEALESMQARLGHTRATPIPVLVIQHDTFETLPLMRERGLPIFPGAVITHEKVAGYKNALFLRQGILGLDREAGAPLAFPTRVGTAGFDFPWKNFDLLAKITKKLGLQCLVISPGMTKERVKELRSINPDTFVQTTWQSAEFVVSQLAECLATAFLYQCGNSGTSGAIRLGLAARRPVVAFQCRQFRDLAQTGAVKFAQDEQELTEFLAVLRFSPELQKSYSEFAGELAEADSWTQRGKDYYGIYKTLVEEK